VVELLVGSLSKLGARMPTILIADDSVTVRSTVKVHLMGHGYEFIDAEDGARALRLMRIVPVALAIIDYRMPGMDGVALTQRIREEASAASRIPIVIVSSDHDPTLRERAMAAGAGAFLRKPVSGTELLSAVTRLMGRKTATITARGPSVAAIPAPTAPSMRPRRELG